LESITVFSAEAIHNAIDGFVLLLSDAVDGGASVSFLAPLSPQDARDYWLTVADDVADGARVVLVAQRDGQIAGSVQLAFAWPPNSRHRAEVQKLLVHSQFRRGGIGRALMAAIESEARTAGRTLLVLDTQRGSDAEHLYEKCGYTRAGIIPGYALDNQGKAIDTVFFYRQLG
jgi:ribosomal protein S18 acetylase RimI-like enzyme